MKNRYGLEIRAAITTDAAGLSELFATVGKQIAARELAERLSAGQQQPGAILIAAGWGPPVGVVMLHWYRTLEAAHPTAQISTLLVAPDERRLGIGRLLLKAAAQASRTAGCDAIELMVLPEDAELQAFAQANGFIKSGHGFTRPLRKKV